MFTTVATNLLDTITGSIGGSCTHEARNASGPEILQHLYSVVSQSGRTFAGECQESLLGAGPDGWRQLNCRLRRWRCGDGAAPVGRRCRSARPSGWVDERCYSSSVVQRLWVDTCPVLCLLKGPASRRLVSGRTSVRYRFGSPFSSERLWLSLIHI